MLTSVENYALLTYKDYTVPLVIIKLLLLTKIWYYIVRRVKGKRDIEEIMDFKFWILSISLKARSRKRRSKGLTLIELMMVVLILSVIASIALPLGKIQFVRYKEDRLKRYLDDFRYGIDEFYKHNTTSVSISGDGIDNDGDGDIDEEIYDWKDNDGDGSVDEDVASTGYPRSLYSMVQNHWLRRIPEEPFGNRWQYRPSTGGPSNWKDFVDYGGLYEAQTGDDIYDIRSDGSHVNTAIDGSQYSDW